MILTRVPLRISLLGGGTDIRDFFNSHGGAVLSMSINKYVYVCLNKSFDDRVRVSYSKTEVVNNVNELEHDIIRESLKMYGIEKGIEVVTISDVPGVGTGLGSSSALAVGMMVALEQYKYGKTLNQNLAAIKACNLEINILKKPIGEQDQWGTAVGGLKFIRWNPCRTITQVVESDLVDHLMLFYSKQSRNNDSILTEQLSNMKKNVEILKLMRDSAHNGFAALKINDYRSLGYLVKEGWEDKKKLANGMSNPAIDLSLFGAYMCGAWGGKSLGAGGSFLLLVAPPESHNYIKQALNNFTYVPFGIDSGGATIVYK